MSALARGLHVAALFAVGAAAVLFLAAIRVGGWSALGWAAAAVAMLGVSFLLAPLALVFAAAGQGALTRAALVTDAALCVLGVLAAGAAAFSPDLGFAGRAFAALVAALDAWGLAMGPRLWRAA